MARDAGFSYVEVLASVALVAIALVPAIEGLGIGMQGAAFHATEVEEHYHVLGRLEEVLAEPFATLDGEAVSVGDANTPTSYSDAGGTVRRRLVFLSRYDALDSDADGDPFTGGDDRLLWVRVELENSERALQTLTTP